MQLKGEVPYQTLLAYLTALGGNVTHENLVEVHQAGGELRYYKVLRDLNDSHEQLMAIISDGIPLRTHAECRWGGATYEQAMNVHRGADRDLNYDLIQVAAHE